jgi:hypothetical protein
MRCAFRPAASRVGVRGHRAWLPARHLGRRVLIGRGADIIIIDDPLKPKEALSQTQPQAATEWFHHTLCVDPRSNAGIVELYRRRAEELCRGQASGPPVRLRATRVISRVQLFFWRKNFTNHLSARPSN